MAISVWLIRIICIHDQTGGPHILQALDVFEFIVHFLSEEGAEERFLSLLN